MAADGVTQPVEHFAIELLDGALQRRRQLSQLPLGWQEFLQGDRHVFRGRIQEVIDGGATAANVGLAPWPLADSAIMPAGYVPVGRTLADYLDSNDFMPANLAQVGVLVPADAAEAEQLRRYLQGTTATR